MASATLTTTPRSARPKRATRTLRERQATIAQIDPEGTARRRATHRKMLLLMAEYGITDMEAAALQVARDEYPGTTRTEYEARASANGLSTSPAEIASVADELNIDPAEATFVVIARARIRAGHCHGMYLGVDGNANSRTPVHKPGVQLRFREQL